MSDSPHEADVSWDTLRRIIRQWAGESAELDEVSPLIGGSINTTLLLKTRQGDRAVLKICAHRVNRAYADEAAQLHLLRDKGLPVPTVYDAVVGSLDNPFSYLLMEYIEAVDLHEVRHKCSAEQFDALQIELAEAVADMHDQTAKDYHKIRAPNGQHAPPGWTEWPAFFRSVYDSIWLRVDTQKLLTPKCRKHLQKVHDRLDQALRHGDCPRLLHGDLWATNVLAKRDASGQWKLAALIDPNSKFAHAEMEIAYLELFQTVTPAFVKAYQQRHPLNGEYNRTRKWVYQMYFLLDHVNLFGQEYVKPLESAVERAFAGL